MRLKADQPEARNVKAVLLDGKNVPMPHEADEEEGWVKSYVADLPDLAPMNGEELIEDEETVHAGFKLVKRVGQVRIVFNDISVDNKQA